MKKLILSLVAIATISLSSFGQAPEGFKYQAVVRGAGNTILNNQAVGIRMTIQQGSIGGTTVFQETFAPTTNAYGLINLEIGNGTIVSGDFTTVDWANGPYFIEMAVDVTGGASYTVIGTSQLMSVPYALHAKTAENVLNDLDNDPTNEIELPTGGTNGQVLKTDGSGTYTWINQTTDTNTQLDETAVDAMVANNGYLSSISIPNQQLTWNSANARIPNPGWYVWTAIGGLSTIPAAGTYLVNFGASWDNNYSGAGAFQTKDLPNFRLGVDGSYGSPVFWGTGAGYSSDYWEAATTTFSYIVTFNGSQVLTAEWMAESSRSQTTRFQTTYLNLIKLQ